MLQSLEFRQLKAQCGIASKWILSACEKPSRGAVTAYNPVEDRWRRLPDIPGISPDTEFTGFCFATLHEKLFVIGGMENDKVTSSVQIFDFSSSRWSRGPSLTEARSWCAATTIGDSIVVSGGQGARSFLKSAEVYDAKRNRWCRVADMSVARSSHQMVALSGQVWAIAGECERHQRSAVPTQSYKGSAEVYSPDSKTWKTVPKMWPYSEKKVPGPCTILGNQIVSTHMGRLIKYEERSNEWIEFGRLPRERGGESSCNSFGFVGMNHMLYTFGGLQLVDSRARMSYQKRVGSMEKCDASFLDKPKAVHEKQFATFKPVTPPCQLAWKSGEHMGDFGGVVLATVVLDL